MKQIRKEIRIFHSIWVEFLGLFFKVLPLLFFLSTFSFDNIAQKNELQFTSHLTVEDGLSLNVLTGIIQDKRGFLWFGTYDGLNRYDGYNFKNFTEEPDNPKSISNFLISSLLEDSKGYIWVGTNNGLNRYDWKTEEFKRYIANPSEPNSLSHNHILCIYEDKSGGIWIGTSNGLNKYNRDTDDFTVSTNISDEINENSLNSVTSIVEDNDANIYLGTWKGLTKIQGNNGNIITIPLPEAISRSALLYNRISKLIIDNDKNLWIATNNGQGVYKYNLVSEKLSQYFNEPSDPNSLSDNQANTLLLDKSGRIWIGTENGLNMYSGGEKFIRYTHDPSQYFSIISNCVYSVIEDQTGLFWIGTDRGISRAYLPINDFNFANLYYKNSDGTLGSNRINALYCDKPGHLWIGSPQGLFTFDEISKKIIPLNTFNEKKITVSNNNIRSICRDNFGNMWLGTNGGGLNCFNIYTGENILYHYDDSDPESLSNNGVISLCIDKDENVWAGTWWGLNLLNKETGKFERFTNFFSNLCWVLYSDSEGKLWIGTDGGGVNEMNPESKTTTNYLNGLRVISIYESFDGMMWFGTTEGLRSYNRKTGKFETFTKVNGLPSNAINSICEDNLGNIWISTDKGFSKYDRNNNLFRNYDKRNGLSNPEFSVNAAAKSKNGDLYFGGLTGLLYFSPGKIQDQFIDANVVLTDFKIYNQSVPISNDGNSVLKESITVAKSVQIPYGNDVLSIDFALLDYYNVNRNKFMYILEGFDKEWNDIGTRNSATYTNLPPGEYKFHVRASNDAGFKNFKETSVDITIIPAYYQTWLFRIIFFVIIVVGLLFFIRIRTNAMRRRNLILENKVIERTQDLDKTINELNLEIATKNKFFSIIAHDLRSPFTAMLGFSKHLVDEIESLSREELHLIAESIYKSTSLTFGLLENLLHWARIQTGKIEFKPIELKIKDMLEKTTELYKGNAENKGINITIETTKNISVYADSNMVETVLRNLLSNSIKFTNEGGEIIVGVADIGNFVEISVKDTGVGIPQEKIDKMFEVGQSSSTLGTRNEKGSGLGLILCKEFIEYNSGTIRVDSKEGKYSKISFTLPKYKDQQKHSYTAIND